MLKYTTYKSIHKSNSTDDNSAKDHHTVSAADTSAQPAAHSVQHAPIHSTSDMQSIHKTEAGLSEQPAVTEWVYVDDLKSAAANPKSAANRARRSLSRKTLDLIQMTARKTLGKKSTRRSPKRKSGWNSSGRLMVCLLFASVLLYGSFQHLVIADESVAMKQHVIVNEGDSLWAIASQYKAPGEDIRDYIAEIRDENHLNTSDIRSGDVLVIPHR
ncbi:LysM peptidoglycan-binding domain-containing protein [Paenibacillus sp. SGZ-1009]|uniref:LysM peptidoglycan-binding domain-containing protein n=1 Tax=Paenibacillus campi TaxID=3106031 RepID=UPI002AFE7ACA|nr:LysM peptidoglycan-binding domain-containing protein [Paenibacillus sp. SGZ-1009]